MIIFLQFLYDHLACPGYLCQSFLSILYLYTSLFIGTNGLHHAKRDIRIFALSVVSDQPAHSAHTNSKRHLPLFLFLIWLNLLEHKILCSRKVPSRISLRELRRLIPDDTLRKCPNVPIRVLQAKYTVVTMQVNYIFGHYLKYSERCMSRIRPHSWCSLILINIVHRSFLLPSGIRKFQWRTRWLYEVISEKWWLST